LDLFNELLVSLLVFLFVSLERGACRGVPVLKWSLCNQQHHEIRIQGIANYVIEAKK
jgi:hypothetical protein